MVDLTAQNMVNTQSKNRNEWGAELQRVLSETGDDYIVMARRVIIAYM